MKRKALCVFSLIAYLLIFCSCLSPVVEREMATLADIKHVKKNTMRNTTLPIYTARWGETEGLFHVKEGSDWNTGLRVQEIPRMYYSADEYYGEVTLHPETYDLILSASRTPRIGDRVQQVELQDSPNEKLIVYCPQGIEELVDRNDKFTVLAQSETALLLDTTSSPMPYFEHFTVFSLSKRVKAQQMRVYSYTDAESFIQALPQVAVLGGVLLFAVILWGGSCALTKKQQPAWLLWGNAGLLCLSLAVLPWLGGKIDLPASLMPPENILDLAHYRSEFGNIFSVLEQVGDQSLQDLCTQRCVGALAVLVSGIFLAAAILWTERKLLKKLRSRREIDN